jgi:hypothetical protein
MISAAKIARTGMPFATLAAAAALSTGAYAGYAARTASRPGGRTFTVTVSPGRDTASAGSTAGYRLRIHRRRFPGLIAFKFAQRLPAGAAAYFAPRRTRRSRSTLTIKTSSWTRAGNYRLLLRPRSGRHTRTVALTLTVAGASSHIGTANVTPPPFSIAGNVENLLEPGAPQAIDLQISNPNALPLVVTNLSAAVRSIRAPNATATLPCTSGDFAMQPFSGPLPLTVPASSTRNLAELGVPEAQWPHISIVDLATDLDGCKGASLTLVYSALATLG